MKRNRHARRRSRPRADRLESRDVPAAFGNAWPMPMAMSISFVPDGTLIGPYASDLQEAAPAAWGPDWQLKILGAFQTWASHTGMNFSLNPDGGQPLGSPGFATTSAQFGDVRVAAHPMPLDVVAYSIPFDGSAGTWSGDLILNSAYAGTTPGVPAVDLYSVVLHEAGNLLGFPDSEDPRSPLFDFYRDRNSELQPDDVRALRELYGSRPPDRYEGPAGNDSPATATPIVVGPWGPAEAVLADLGPGDVDVFRVTAPEGAAHLQFRVMTRWISLMTSQVTVRDDRGRVVGSAASAGPKAGWVDVDVVGPAAGRDYFVEVRGARGDAFDVGSYALVVDSAAGAFEALDRLKLEELGSMYFMSHFENGLPSTTADWAPLLDILYRTPPQGHPAAYTEALGRVVDASLASLGGAPFNYDAFLKLGEQVTQSYPDTLLEPGMIPALLSALDERGALNGLMRDLWVRTDLRGFLKEMLTSGSLDQAFEGMLASGDLYDLARELWASPEVRGELLGLIDSGGLDPLLFRLQETGSLDDLISKVLPDVDPGPSDAAGLRRIASDLLARFDQWGADDEVLGEFLQGLTGERGASAEFRKLLGSGALDELGQAMLGSRPLSHLTAAFLSAAWRHDPTVMAVLYRAFTPTPNPDFATARELLPYSNSPDVRGRHLVAMATTDDARTTTVSKVVVPTFGGRAPATMLVTAREIMAAATRPLLKVYDGDGRAVDFEVLDAGPDDYIVQVRNPVAGATYYIQLTQGGVGGGSVPSTYLLDAYFGDERVDLEPVAAGDVDAGNQVRATYVASETQIVHWLLSARGAGPGSGSIRLQVVDESGAVVYGATARVGEDVGVVVHLPVGAYTLLVAGLPGEGGTASALSYELRGNILSDSINPYPADASLRPVDAIAATAESAEPRGARAAGGVGIATIGPISAPHLNSFGAEGPAVAGLVSVARGLGAALAAAPPTGLDPAARSDVAGRGTEPARAGEAPKPDDAPRARPAAGVASVVPAAPARRGRDPAVPPTADSETAVFDALEAVARLPHDLAVEAIDGAREMAGGGPAELAAAIGLFAGGASRLVVHRRSRGPAPRGPVASFRGERRRSGRSDPLLPRRVLIVRSSSRRGADLAFRRWLEADGVEVHEATGRTWEAWPSPGPDVILLEHGPGTTTGADLLFRIGQSPSTATTPIIVFSDAASGEIAAAAAAEGLDLGAADVLPRSITPEEFRARLRRAMRDRRQVERLEHEAASDGLTGLSNRAALQARLDGAWADCRRAGRPLGLLVADLDHFKRVNDTCGHPAGDQVLRRVAAALADEVGAAGFAARYGGEEFVVVAPGCDRAGLMRIAERLRRRIGGLRLDDLRLPCRVTISVGAAWARTLDPSGSQQLLTQADRALYEAKAAGRDAVRMADGVAVPG
ncbi:diguanylate cyclase [Paludisphaera mucosa]|uniref:diguanylate cyclase n=1 Tax=Paludisphaera mucosa TaxID=3030827 RepID=A0ABT6FKG9_9BACT|nr:diguanylate cyclase [Paludisphaera mucosa]MDG3008078.1 diguanylate cyclase [Paludisphaera mucosa]